MSIKQMIINTESDLESLCFDKDEEWKTHLEKFTLFMSKLALYNKPASAADKVSMLIWALPFAPIEVVPESSKFPFEKACTL